MQPTNDYLSTMVVAGGGTPTLTLKDKLVNGVNGAKAFLDAAPGILAAAEVAGKNGQTLYIPSAGRGQNFYQINSMLDLPPNLDVLQVGQLRLGETMIVNAGMNWRGRSGAAPPQFGWKASPRVYVVEANPGIYLQYGALDFDSVSIGAGNGANQALLMVVDSAWGSTFKYLNLTTGGPDDMMGIALLVRDSTNTSFSYPNFSGGPDQVIDKTWTPFGLHAGVTKRLRGNRRMEHRARYVQSPRHSLSGAGRGRDGMLDGAKLHPGGHHAFSGA